MPRNLVIAAVVILFLIVSVWFLTRSDKQTSQTPAETSTSPESSAPSTASDAAVPVDKVSITAGGFSPKAITVKIGQSVIFENMDSANHIVNSDPHPTHTMYSFLNVGLIKPGESKTVMFEKTGQYTFHDHLNPSLTGTVTVE